MTSANLYIKGAACYLRANETVAPIKYNRAPRVYQVIDNQNRGVFIHLQSFITEIKILSD